MFEFSGQFYISDKLKCWLLWIRARAASGKAEFRPWFLFPHKIFNKIRDFPTTVSLPTEGRKFLSYYLYVQQMQVNLKFRFQLTLSGFGVDVSLVQPFKCISIKFLPSKMGVSSLFISRTESNTPDNDVHCYTSTNGGQCWRLGVIYIRHCLNVIHPQSVIFSSTVSTLHW